MVEWAKDEQVAWESIVAKYGGLVESFQVEAFTMLNWGFNPSIEITTPFMSTIDKLGSLAGLGGITYTRPTFEHSTLTRMLVFCLALAIGNSDD